VLTLNWNGRLWLEACLRSILALDYPNFDVTVVDNGSTDGSQEFVRSTFPTVRLIENGRNLGYGPGLNVGLRDANARGAEFFLIMNNDTVIDRAALRALVETSTSHVRAGFVVGKVYWEGRENVLQTVGKRADPFFWNGATIGRGERDRGQYDEVAERLFVDDVYVLVNRAVYADVGGYDPNLFLQAEELDWQARARRRGWRCYFTPYARLWHHGSRSMGGLGSPISQYFLYRNVVIVTWRHAGLRQFLLLYGSCAKDLSRSLPRALVRRRGQLPLLMAGVFGLLVGTIRLVWFRPATGVPTPIRRLQRMWVRDAGKSAHGAG